jgi:hypothetical protein
MAEGQGKEEGERTSSFLFALPHTLPVFIILFYLSLNSGFLFSWNALNPSLPSSDT